MLGMFDWTPKFVRRYGNFREAISRAAAAYASDVRSGSFPDRAELYTLKASSVVYGRFAVRRIQDRLRRASELRALRSRAAAREGGLPLGRRALQFQPTDVC